MFHYSVILYLGLMLKKLRLAFLTAVCVITCLSLRIIALALLLWCSQFI